MSKDTIIRRSFATILIVGGAFGLVIGGLAAAQVLGQDGMRAAAAGAVALAFAWAAFTGLRLWQGTPYGRKWAPILFASQIPVIALPGIQYYWYTGAYIGGSIRFGDRLSGSHIGAVFGAGSEFFFGPDVTGFVIGINVFAIIALILLIHANESFQSDQQVGRLSQR